MLNILSERQGLRIWTQFSCRTLPDGDKVIALFWALNVFLPGSSEMVLSRHGQVKLVQDGNDRVLVSSPLFSHFFMKFLLIFSRFKWHDDVMIRGLHLCLYWLSCSTRIVSIG